MREGHPEDVPRPRRTTDDYSDGSAVIDQIKDSMGPHEKLAAWVTARWAKRQARKEIEMAKHLVNQPTSAPTRKVKAGAIGGVLVAGLIALSGWLGYPLPEEMATEIASALIVLGSSVASYMTRGAA